MLCVPTLPDHSFSHAMALIILQTVSRAIARRLPSLFLTGDMTNGEVASRSLWYCTFGIYTDTWCSLRWQGHHAKPEVFDRSYDLCEAAKIYRLRDAAIGIKSIGL